MFCGIFANFEHQFVVFAVFCDIFAELRTVARTVCGQFCGIFGGFIAIVGPILHERWCHTSQVRFRSGAAEKLGDWRNVGVEGTVTFAFLCLSVFKCEGSSGTFKKRVLIT